MTQSGSSFPITYQGVLRDYLARPDEANLQQGYELGRAAMSAGLGVLDIIRLHDQAVADLAPAEGLETESTPFALAFEAFLLEVLSPFEAAYRGFRLAREHLQQLNGAMADRNGALAESNARLQAEIAVRQRTEAALHELSARVLSTQEEERTRISRELHDEIGQALIAVNVAIAMLKKDAGGDPAFQRKVAKAEELLSQTMETVHTFARELRPAMLDHFGLHSALRAHLKTFTGRTGIRAELVVRPDFAQVQGERRDVFFRVAQEALNNVFKHAHATRVRVELISAGEMLGMEIADNGRAFCVEEKLNSRITGRLGLIGMRERVHLVGGEFKIESIVGRGTVISVRIPAGDPEDRAAPLPFHEENIRIAG